MKGLVLVIGSEGMVGSRFVEISELRKSFQSPRQIELDITRFAEIKALVSSYDFNAIVNFAAFTDVDKAEAERGNKEGECFLVNVEGVRNLVEVVKPLKEKINFIQISTDMVFPGIEEDPGPYLENHPLDHDLSYLTWYGFTKSQAEKIVLENLGEFGTIVRINFPVRANFPQKLDFFRKPLKLFDEGKLPPLFSDQQISITYIDELVKLLDKIIQDNIRGVFHASSKDVTTPYEAISYFIEKARKAEVELESISLEEFLRQKAVPFYRYPKYLGLSTQITEHKTGISFSSWRQIVEKLILQGVASNQPST